MAPYAEPTTNKSSFRFGSQLHLLRGLTTTVRPGVVLGCLPGWESGWWSRSSGLSGWEDGRERCVCLLAGVHGRVRGLESPP